MTAHPPAHGDLSTWDQPQHPPPRTATGSATSADWTQLVGDVLVEGTAPSDPGNLADATSSYDPVTGVFSFLTDSAGGVIHDGIAETTAGFSFPIVSLYPDYDPELDVIELKWKFTNPTTDTGLGWGIGIGLFDGDASTYLSWKGQRLMAFNSSAGSWTTGYTNGSLFAGSTIVSGLTEMIAEFRTFPDGVSNGMTMQSALKIAAGWRGGPGDDLVTINPIVTANMHGVVCLMAGETTAPADEPLSGTLWHRRTRMPPE